MTTAASASHRSHRSPTGRRVLAVVVAVLAGLVLAVAIDVARAGGPGLWLARHGLPPPYLGGGRMVAVGEGSFYLDCRGRGAPVVVLEAGAGSGAASWSPVFDAIAETTRTCAYDRAGIAGSDPRGRHTLADSARDLRDLLAAAGAPAPYVVVGHSLGGAYARVFGAQQRDATAAIVLLDSFDPDLQTDGIHPLLGDLVPEYESDLDGLRATVELWENLDWATSEQQLRNGDLRGLRIAVLRAPRYEGRLDEATNERIRRAMIDRYERLSPGHVTYELAPGAGHMVHIDRPDLVVELVRRVVAEAR